MSQVAMDPLIEEEISTQGSFFNPVTYVFTFLSSYGWYLVGAGAVTAYLLNLLRPHLRRWKQAREDALYHKDPDTALARMEAIQRARERQQQMLLEASERAVQLQKEREERKRAEVAERLRKYGAAVGGGHTLGTGDDYLPLSGGSSTSSYRPPKKSKCGGGGCGR